VVTAAYTSSSNAYAAGCAMVLREAIELCRFDWRRHGATLPAAMMALFQEKGQPIHDPDTGLTFPEIDLLAVLDHVFGAG
jgi:hypothetical protein